MTEIRSTPQTTASMTPPTPPPKTAGGVNGEMNKDAFLRLLVTQLKHQDPTKPMENREFISQMAQFSALEQMTNVREGLDALSKVQTVTQSFALVGRSVSLKNPEGEEPVRGTVAEVRVRSGEARLVVGGQEYSMADLISVQ